MRAEALYQCLPTNNRQKDDVPRYLEGASQLLHVKGSCVGPCNIAPKYMDPHPLVLVLLSKKASYKFSDNSRENAAQ